MGEIGLATVCPCSNAFVRSGVNRYASADAPGIGAFGDGSGDGGGAGAGAEQPYMDVPGAGAGDARGRCVHPAEGSERQHSLARMT